ncbi:MAG: CIA30 family protein [Myxococcota bacterium]|nr:CIA30 family protein [Myxococcota bacterium]
MSGAGWLLAGVLLGQGWSERDWVVVNDTVMGGVSSSAVEAHGEEGVVFKGYLSLENNGGFTSARLDLGRPDWSAYDGLTVDLVGDGRKYLLTARTSDQRMRRIYYRYPVQTVAGERVSITVPFEDFQAYAYGTRVPQAPGLRSQLSQLGTVGVMLADERPGEFELQIVSMEPSRSENFEAPEAVQIEGTVVDVLDFAISQGVPLYNNGAPERCADIYQTAIVSVLMLSEDELSEAEREVLMGGLRSAGQARSESDRAWALRRAMDVLLQNRL